MPMMICAAMIMGSTVSCGWPHGLRLLSRKVELIKNGHNRVITNAELATFHARRVVHTKNLADAEMVYNPFWTMLWPPRALSPAG
ncbi:hypothetical protein LMTR3_21200 [Bradyrhizobium sp. LMTR 3]|nr:hypothetical protein LMTR3_21200 [Bradyrhizobium sp. LMTR 3]